MSRSKSELSITQRAIIELVRYKTRNNYLFFANNEYIAKAIDITPQSAKTMINMLIRKGYLAKTYDKQRRRVLTVTDKPYQRLYDDLSGVDKKVLKLELKDATNDSLYYSAQLNGAELNVQRTREENSKLQDDILEYQKEISILKTENKQLEQRIGNLETIFYAKGISKEELDFLVKNISLIENKGPTLDIAFFN